MRYALLLVLFCSRCMAWGPHPEITQAALDALGTNDALLRHLGKWGQQLTNYAWLADYRRLPLEDGPELFYADDYLLFPGVSVHYDHICPEVKQTYEPYFRRALQALRTESPANAARWIGSLLHFVEDTGSPPHAAEIRGGVHSKMENWINAKLIRIQGYSPQLLGTNDESGVQGLAQRMEELIAYSKVRGEKLRVQVEIGRRQTVEPVVLESALETSRATADLLFTLGQLAARPGTNSGLGALQGQIKARIPPGLERFPAKVVVAGTKFSTLTDSEGRYIFRNLPAGPYEIIAIQAGSETRRINKEIEPGQTNLFDITLDQGEGNLIRNGDFKTKWVRSEAPDCWNTLRGSWEGEIIPLKIGQKYQVSADFQNDSPGKVVVRWTKYLPHAMPRQSAVPLFDSRTLTADEPAFTFVGAEKLGLLQVSLQCGSKKPMEVWKKIKLVAVSD